MRNYWFTAFAIILLVLTNPTKDEFKTWSIQQGNNMKAADSAETAKMAMISTFASMLLDSAVIRTNYVVFSTYTSSTNDQCLIVGVLGNFFDLSKDPIKRAEKPLESSPSEIAPPISETVDSVNPSSLIQQQLEHVTTTISPVASEAQIADVISAFLAAKNVVDPNLTEQAELLVKSGLANTTLRELVCNSNNSQSMAAIKALLAAGANANDKDQNGRTALMLASAFAKDIELITVLIKFGADVNIRDAEEQTSLMFAAMLNSNAKIVATLIDGGAEVNAIDKKGFNALMFASAFTKNAEVITTLVERGANTLHRDSIGRTAFDYVKANKNVNDVFAESSDGAFKLVAIGLGQSIIIDDIKITPQNVRIDQIVKKNMIFDTTTQSESKYLLVNVTLENVSSGKIIYLQNIWKNTKLVDDFDNIENTKFSDNLSAMWDLISDAIKSTKLRPGEVVRDMLIFDIPVNTAKNFTIDSDPKFWKNIGEDRLQEISKSSFRIKFSSDQINRLPLSDTTSKHATDSGSTQLSELYRQANEIDSQWERSQKKAMEDLNKTIKDYNESNQRILEDTLKQMKQLEQFSGY
ncbi:MAG: Ankyrin repeat protein [bacterium ADurb.Bin157]|jgi:hypothetical protein|nr:MAG: Ankyrin repeat protein [bacterium ADurb.Bin157]